ncbi:MAG: GNAT family N-acetyltransferase [Thermanaerothrix sp.]|nr:GNAT family N-acetyltransferase [Thermanaerothrix sp.]
MELRFKLLSPDDVGENYVKWMNDPEVTRYLESRFRSYTRQDLVEFVKAASSSGRDFLFGIFDGEHHIGNIKIGSVDWRHRYGDLGLVVGLKEYWGRGIATQAIMFCCSYAHRELGLRKLFAGIYDGNTGSLKAFLKAGFRRVGVFAEHRLLDGRYVDEVLVEKLLSS